MPRLFLVGEDMIIGIGTDIVEIDRVAKAIKGEAFVKRVFTPAEAEYCRSRKAGMTGERIMPILLYCMPNMTAMAPGQLPLARGPVGARFFHEDRPPDILPRGSLMQERKLTRTGMRFR